jgi:nucleoid DNA-binding protein
MTYEESCGALGANPVARLGRRPTEEGEGAAVPSLDLTGRVFDRLTLPHLCVIGARLTGCGLSRADLSQSVLRAFWCIDVDFTDADLHDCDLASSTFVRCRFDGANLRGSDARDTLFHGCTFARARVDELVVLARQLPRYYLEVTQRSFLEGRPWWLPLDLHGRALTVEQRSSLRQVGPPAFEGAPASPGDAVTVTPRPSVAEWIARFLADPPTFEMMPLAGLGLLRRTAYEGYQGRNPRTGQVIAVPPKIVTSFALGEDDPEWPEGTSDAVRGEGAVLAEEIREALASAGAARVPGLGEFSRRERHLSHEWVTGFRTAGTPIEDDEE